MLKPFASKNLGGTCPSCPTQLLPMVLAVKLNKANKGLVFTGFTILPLVK